MKKALLVLVLASLTSLVGCQKKENTTTITMPDGRTVTATTASSGKVLSINTK